MVKPWLWKACMQPRRNGDVALNKCASGLATFGPASVLSERVPYNTSRFAEAGGARRHGMQFAGRDRRKSCSQVPLIGVIRRH